MPEIRILPTGWMLATHRLRTTFPEAPWSWLLETGSLTQRLQQICGKNFNLRLLGETETQLSGTDAALLKVIPGTPARCREVQLACAEVPCIYALSLIPLATLHAGGRYLEGLGTRPLGDALFADPCLERGPIKVISLQAGSTFHARVTQSGAATDQPIWGRHSVFQTGGSPLLVCEFFLPQGYAIR